MIVAYPSTPAQYYPHSAPSGDAANAAAAGADAAEESASTA